MKHPPHDELALMCVTQHDRQTGMQQLSDLMALAQRARSFGSTNMNAVGSSRRRRDDP